MDRWIVTNGEARPYDLATLPPRDSYGADWIYVQAASEANALAMAASWDAGATNTETELFVAAYRAEAVGLPGDRRLTLDGLAEAAGMKRNTIQSWRRRHADFPDPTEVVEATPVWWWSDVAQWLRRPRRPGRPATHAVTLSTRP